MLLGVDGCTSDVVEADCSGDYLGDGSSCDACVSGACCLADGSCIQATPEDSRATIRAMAPTASTSPARSSCQQRALRYRYRRWPGQHRQPAATTTGPALVDDCTTQADPQIFNDLYYSYTATCDGEVSFSTCDSAAFDTIIAIYDACGGAQVACNDDGEGCTGFTSTALYTMTTGQTVIVRVGSWSEGVTGEGIMTVECTVPAEGACCVGTDCIDLLPADCTAFGGEYQGTDPCNADSCAILGNTCDDAIAVECNSATAVDNTNNLTVASAN